MRAFPTLLLAAALVTAPGLAQVQAQEKPVPTINVQAVGTATVVPDMALVQLAVVRQAQTARAALDANTQAMSEVMASMKEAGIEDRDLQTSNFDVQPQYEFYDTKPGEFQKPPKIVGYQVTNALSVRIRDLDKIGTVLDRAVTLGVNSGGGIQFSSSRPEAALKQARKRAMESALAKASTLTESAGVALGRIVNISEFSNPTPAMRPMARMDGAMMEAKAVPIAAGEGDYTVTVNVQWEIAQ